MSGKEIEALRKVVEEVRSDAAPECDWQRMEERLMKAVDSPVEAPRATRRGAWVAGVAAVAAAAALLVYTTRSPHSPVVEATPTPVAATSPTAATPDDGLVHGEKLRVGEVVSAETHDVTVKHPGLATWTLRKGSRARLIERGERVTLALLSGSVLARVVPQERPETFAIEARDTRVAVHGTVFRVTLNAESARVKVDEGTVAVGPNTQRGMTRGWLLTAPAAGTFSLDGAKTGNIDGQEVAAAKPRPAAAPQAPEPAPPPAPKPPLPESLSDSELNTGAAQVVSTVQRCFAQLTEPREGVAIDVRSDITLHVSSEGRITTLRFNPPLSPAVQQCSAAVMQNVTFPHSQSGGMVTRAVFLSR